MNDGGSFWDLLDPKYRLILCDIWGVVHDGRRLYPGSAERLLQWRSEGRSVVLVTNAPRPADAVAAHLARVGLPEDAWDAIASSGEAGVEALQKLARPVGFVGTTSDRDILETRGIDISEDDNFIDVVCAGFEEGRLEVQDYRAELEQMAKRGVTFHCLNPDRVVVYGGTMLPCAGALADVYEAMGGHVIWYGKPFRTIYDYALAHGGHPPREEVLAVGDGLQTDMLGAAWMGFDAVFVTGGIHAGEPFPHDFAASHGLGEWQPLAVMGSLG
jgi:HAD superfamily hydrolase (TIGR01459 family)